MTNLYDYPSTFVVKIIVRKNNQTLLVREPKDNEWMPGRLGLPGGKLLLNETIEEGIRRKIAEEIGFEVAVNGLVTLVDIIMPTKTVYMLIVEAVYVSGEIDTSKTYSQDIRWYSEDEIKALNVDDCTEYYLPELLQSDFAVVPLSFIHTQDNRDSTIAQWMAKGAQ